MKGLLVRARQTNSEDRRSRARQNVVEGTGGRTIGSKIQFGLVMSPLN